MPCRAAVIYHAMHAPYLALYFFLSRGSHIDICLHLRERV